MQKYEVQFVRKTENKHPSAGAQALPDKPRPARPAGAVVTTVWWDKRHLGSPCLTNAHGCTGVGRPSGTPGSGRALVVGPEPCPAPRRLQTRECVPERTCHTCCSPRLLNTYVIWFPACRFLDAWSVPCVDSLLTLNTPGQQRHHLVRSCHLQSWRGSGRTERGFGPWSRSAAAITQSQSLHLPRLSPVL